MHWINIGLIFIAGLNLLLAIFVWLLNFKNKINITFSLGMVGVTLWAAFEAFIFMSSNSSTIFFWGILTYVSGIFVALNFLLFSFYFPFEQYKIKNSLLTFIFLIFVITIVISSVPGVLVKEGVLGQNLKNNDLILNPTGFLIYAASFFLFFIWSFCNLFFKYIKGSGFVRRQLKYIIFGTFILFAFGSIFDLIVPYFKGEIFGWVGPYATLIMMISVSLFLFFSGKKIYIK